MNTINTCSLSVMTRFLPLGTALAFCWMVGGTLAPAAAQMPSDDSASHPFISKPNLPAPPVTVETETLAPGSAGQAAAPALSAPARGNVGRHDFGTVNALDTPQVTHDFTLQNNSGAPLTITHIQTSCGCTTATLETPAAAKGARPASPAADTFTATTLAPGQRARVHVAVSLVGHAPGMLYKTVLVFAESQLQPVALLEMQGQLQSDVSFSPPLIDFGQAAGQSAPQTLTATVDARLLPSGQMPALVSSLPAVRISPVPNAGAAPSGTKTTLSRTYRVTLAPDAPLGPLTGTLKFELPAGKEAVPPASAVALAQAAALVVGQVTGDLSASPSLLSFGNVPEGTTKELAVTLTGANARAVQGLTVQSASPWLSAHLSGSGAAKPSPAAGPVPASASAPMRQLTVTLGPQAPHGVQQAQVTVSLASGQRLVLPVTVYVMPPIPAAGARPASVQPIAVTH